MAGGCEAPRSRVTLLWGVTFAVGSAVLTHSLGTYHPSLEAPVTFVSTVLRLLLLLLFLQGAGQLSDLALRLGPLYHPVFLV